MAKEHNLHLRIDTETRDRLKAIADEHYESKSGVVRILIDTAYKKLTEAKPKAKARPRIKRSKAS